MKFTKLAAAITLGLALSTAAHAATQTSSFNVKIKITGTCAANSFPNAALPTASDVSFGSVPSATGAVSLTANNSAAVSQLTVQCTKGTNVTVALSPSNSNASGAGVMGTLPAGDTIAYQLVQPTPSGTPVTYAAGAIGGAAWGSNPASILTVTGQGMAAVNAIKLPVAATITTNNALDVAAGDYNDVVTATLTY